MRWATHRAGLLHYREELHRACYHYSYQTSLYHTFNGLFLSPEEIIAIRGLNVIVLDQTIGLLRRDSGINRGEKFKPLSCQKIGHGRLAPRCPERFEIDVGKGGKCFASVRFRHHPALVIDDHAVAVCRSEKHKTITDASGVGRHDIGHIFLCPCALANILWRIERGADFGTAMGKDFGAAQG